MPEVDNTKGEVLVLWWAPIDGASNGQLIRAYEDEKRAEDDYTLVKDHPTKDYFLDNIPLYRKVIAAFWFRIITREKQCKMKKTIVLILLFIFCFALLSFSGEEARLQYNPFKDKYEFIKPGAVLKYNPFENTNEYVDPEAKIQYNPFEDNYEYVDPPY